MITAVLDLIGVFFRVFGAFLGLMFHLPLLFLGRRQAPSVLFLTVIILLAYRLARRQRRPSFREPPINNI